MDNLVYPCLACLLIGFLGGFAFGFRVAAMVRLAPKQAAQTVAHDVLEEAAA
jgi:hypothetical protein